jgi:hypothetical protein
MTIILLYQILLSKLKIGTWLRKTNCWTGGVAQVVENLLGKSKELSSNPNTATTKTKTKQNPSLPPKNPTIMVNYVQASQVPTM